MKRFLVGGMALILSLLSLSVTFWAEVPPAWADGDPSFPISSQTSSSVTSSVTSALTAGKTESLSPVAAASAHFLSTLPDDYWSIKDIDQLKALIKTDRAQLIDVREPEEYAAGHIEGAVNIPLRLLALHQAFLPDDRPLILYCSSGYRTAMGVTILHLLGLENVYAYQPSLQGWQAAGEPIVASPSLS